MKAIPGYTKQTYERLAQDMHQAMLKSLGDNFAMFAIALSRLYGFGEKRLNDLFNEFNKVEEEFEEHEADGVFDQKIRENLEAIGIKYECIYERSPAISLLVQSDKKKAQSRQMSLKEQFEMERVIREMRMGGKK